MNEILNKNDDLLLLRFNNRDNNAFSQVYLMYFKELHYFTLSLYNDKNIDTEDVIHDAFLYLFQHTSIKFDKLDGIKAYIFVIIKNKMKRDAIHSKRTIKYIDNCLNDEQLFKVSMIETEVYSIIPDILKLLPKDCVEIVRMLIEGYDTDEVALKLNIQKRTVYNRKSEAVNILKNKISKDKLFIITLLLN